MANESTTPFPLQKTSYLSKDILTFRDELIAKLPLITKGKYTNLNESDPGIALLETWLSSVDNLLFYLDMQGQEMDLDRARQRVNVIRLLRLIGYETRGVAASSGTVSLQVAPSSTPVYPVTISKGTQLSAQGDSGQIIFTTTAQASLIGPTDVKTINIVQGTANNDIFISDGTQTQKFLLTSANIDKTTVQVYVDNDPTDLSQTAQWNLVENFFSSETTSTDYRVEVDEFANVYIIFGDGQFGAIPLQNATITASYIITSGEVGNVGANAISRVSSGVPFIQDARGNKVNLNVINSIATAGGDNVQTIEEAKTTALGLLFGLNRALSRGDFEALTMSVPGVTQAVAWGENEEQNPDYRLLNRVRVCFFSKDFADMYYNPAARASYRTLRDYQVKPLLSAKMPITTRLVFIDPLFIDIFASIKIGVDTNKYDPNIVIDQIRSNILDYYSIDKVTLGQDIRVSTILSLANSINGVFWAKVTRLHTTPPDITPDTAPNPPLDIILEKWKIPTLADSPTFIDNQSSSNATPPYLSAIAPEAYSVGANDVKVINPDTQSDILSNGFNYFPGSNLQHISIEYSSITDEPYPTGGYYGSPIPESDLTTTSSLE